MHKHFWYDKLTKIETNVEIELKSNEDHIEINLE